MSDWEDRPRRPISPAMVVIALGVIASLLYPVGQVFLTTPESLGLAAKGFGFVIVVMAALALFQLARALTKRPPEE